MAVISIIDMADQNRIGGIVDWQVSAGVGIFIGVKDQRHFRGFKFECGMTIPGDGEHLYLGVHRKECADSERFYRDFMLTC